MKQDNEFLRALPNEEEIFVALKQIPNQKALGQNGMIALSYRDYWNIIKSEVIMIVKNFFQSGELLKQMNDTNIALIQKNSQSKLTPRIIAQLA